MPTVTAIEKQKRKQRANVHLDGEYALSLRLDVILTSHLAIGAELPRAQFDACVRRLLEGGFLTAHGVATEAVTSPHYEPDGDETFD